MNSARQIKFGAVMSYVVMAFNILMGIIYTPWMIRVLGQSDYGVYGIANSVIAFCTMDFGLGSAISRFIAKYQAEKNEDKIRKFIGIALKLYLVIDLGITIALCIIYFFLDKIYVSLTPAELSKLNVVFVITGTFTVFSFPFQILNGIIVARERFILQKVLDCVSKVLTVALIVISLYSGGGLYSLVIVNAGVGCLVIFLKLFYLKRAKIVQVEWKYWDGSLVREIFSFSIWITIILIMQRFILNITPTILGITSGTKDISVFTAAMSIEGYTYTLTGVLSGFFLTRVSNMLYGEAADVTKVEQLMVKIGRIQLLIIGAICAIFLSVGKEFVDLWLGRDFRDVYYVVSLLILPMLVIATQGIADTALTAVGEVKYRAINVSITAIVSMTLSLVLSKKFGAIGAGIGIFIARVASDIIVFNIICVIILKINIVDFFKRCHLSMALPILITFFAGLCLQKIPFGGGWIYFILKCCILAVLYLILMWFLSCDESEKKIFYDFYSKILNYMRREHGKRM